MLAGIALIAYGFGAGRVREAGESAAAGLEVIPEELTLQDDSGETSESVQIGQFVLRNPSSKPIKILEAVPECDCTGSVNLPVSQLMPGDEVAMTVRVTIPATGGRRTAIRIVTDSPSQSIVFARLKLVGAAINVPSVVEQPRELRLIIPPESTGTSEDVTIRTVERLGSAPWLSGLETDDTRIVAELTETRVDREFVEADVIWREYRFRITASAAANAADWTVKLIAGAHTEPADCLSPIDVFVDRANVIEAVPSSLFFGGTAGTEGTLEKVVELSTSTKLKWAVVNVVSNDPRVVASVVEPASASVEASSNFVRVVLNREAESNNEAAEIVSALVRAETTIPDQRYVEIPVSFAANGSAY
jgi:hypothetical protein